MEEKLNQITVSNFITEKGILFKSLSLSYQKFGPKINTAPVVLVNHALTGNSNVCGQKNSWWNQIVGEGKVLNTQKYTIISIDILGNGYNGKTISNYKAFNARDIAKLFLEVLKKLNIEQLFAIIGGSIGGGIAWEMAVLKPNLTQYLIPIASHWKATDWLVGHCHVQSLILKTSNQPLEVARQHAMLIYRTPRSFESKFKNNKVKTKSWLNHHGKALKIRFSVQAYLMVNHLLSSVDITQRNNSFESAISNLSAIVVQIGIDSDLFFPTSDMKKTKQKLSKVGIQNHYFEIKSIHGHDAFLIEFDQIINILKPIFN
ncbi:MAG: alpha/beta fold hydrolase [Putridiphycobacter sp.]